MAVEIADTVPGYPYPIRIFACGVKIGYRRPDDFFEAFLDNLAVLRYSPASLQTTVNAGKEMMETPDKI